MRTTPEQKVAHANRENARYHADPGLHEVRPTEVRHFHALFARYFDDVKYPGQFDMDALNDVWAPLIGRGAATLRIAMFDGYTVGVSGTTYMRDTFNGELTATMVFFWVDPQVRGRGIGKALLEQAEQDAQLRGCTNLVHGHMFTVDEDGGRRMFEKRGYEVVELGFRKRLLKGKPWTASRQAAQERVGGLLAR